MLKDVLKKFKKMSLFYVLNGIIQILAASLAVVYFQKIIDKVPLAKSYKEVLSLIIVYGLLLLLDCLLCYVDEYPNRMLSKGIEQEFKISALKKISRIDYVSYQKLGTGSLIQLIENGAEAGKNILFDFYMNLFRNLLPSITISLILIGTYNIEIMAVIFIGYLIVFAISNKLMKYLYKIKDKILISEEWLSRYFVRGFMELVVFRLNKRFHKEICKIEETSNAVVKSKAKIRMIHELFFALFALIIIVIKLIILFIGVNKAINGETTVGIIIALISFVDRIYSPIAIFNVIFIDYKLDKVAFNRFVNFMKLPDDINLNQGTPMDIEKGLIEFKNVSFKYDSTPILNNLSFKIEGNSSTALVGSSGGGKSTIIKMILGLLKPDSGEILVDENDNPYADIKKYYNMEILKMTEAIDILIKNSDDKFNTALKIAIAGNLIDFAAKHKFDLEMLKEKIMNIEEINLAIDHSKDLYERLKTAKTVMYLGDNCGEICLDKLFIKYIKSEFPNIEVYFGVRGKIIVNDVTFDDALMVGMQKVAAVIENGDSSLGTVIERVSDEFKEKFYHADVVIAKGQGNYESLSESDKNNIFHLFMAKCEPVSNSLGVKSMSILCVENKPSNLNSLMKF